MNQRGMVMAIALGVVVMFTTLGAAFLVRSLNESLIGTRHANRQAAFYLADGGIDRAIAELKNNQAWAGIGYTPIGIAELGGYEVTVATLTPTLRRITSTGHFPSNVTTTPGYQRRQVETVVSFSTPGTFDHALFTATTIEMDSNALINSYDSRLGAYSTNTNAGAEGDVGSNAPGAGTITLHSNAKVKGDAVVGPGANINTAIVTNGNSQITGTRGALLQPKSLTCQSFPSGTATEALTLDSHEIKPLAAGTYRYSSVHLNSNAQVRVTGDVTIYVEQSFKLDSNALFATTCGDCSTSIYQHGQGFGTPCGNCSLTIYVDGCNGPPETPAVDLDSNTVLSAGNKPGQLTLIVTSTSSSTPTRSIKTDSNSAILGAINAPCTTFEMDSNAELFGAAMVKEAELDSNAQIHYDVSLKEQGQTGGQSLSIVSWRDLN